MPKEIRHEPPATAGPPGGEAPEETPANTVEVEEIAPCKVLLKVTVPVERVQSELEKSYGELGANLVYPGFRKGRVPRPILEKRFGDQIQEEVREGLKQSTFEEAVEEKSLHPLGEPQFENVEYEKEKPLSYEVKVNVRPEFDLPEYDGIEVEEPPVEPTQDEIEAAVRGILKQRAVLVTAEDGVAREEDYLIADIGLLVGDERVYFEEEASVPVGGDVAFGIHDPRIKDLLVGAKVDVPRELEVDIPDSFPEERHRGKKGKITLAPKEVKRVRVPELDEDLAKQLDFDSVEEFREDVARRVREQKEAEKDGKISDAIIEKMLAGIDVPLPEDIIESQTDAVETRLRLRLLRAGLDEAAIDDRLQKERARSKEGVARMLREMFLLDKLADAEKIFVTEDEVDRQVEIRARVYGMSFPTLKDHMRESGDLAALRGEMRHEKARALLREKAKVSPPSGPSKPSAKGKKKASGGKRSAAKKRGSKKKKDA